MANEVGRLFVTLGLNSSDFHKKLTAAEKAAERQARSMQKEFEKMVKPIEQAFALVSAAALGASVAIGIAVKKTAEFADSIDDASKRTGVAVERLQTLNYASKITGTSLDGLEKGLKILSNNMLDASRDTGTAKVTFNELNIAVKNSDGTLRKTTDVLSEAADKIGTMKDATKQAAYANDLFGKSGTTLLPLLKMGASGIAELESNLQKYGYVMSSKEIAAGETFNDNLLTMQMAVEGLGMRFSTKLIPALNEYLVKGLEWVAQNKDIINSKMDSVVAKISDGFKLLADNKDGIIAVFNAMVLASEAVMKSVSGWMMIINGLSKTGKALGSSNYTNSIGGRVGNQYTAGSSKNSSTNVGGYAPLNSALSTFSPWMLGVDSSTNTWISEAKKQADSAADSIDNLSNKAKKAKESLGYGGYIGNYGSGSKTYSATDLNGKSGMNYGKSSGLSFRSSSDVVETDLFDSFNAQNEKFMSSMDEHNKKVDLMRDRWAAFGDTMSSVLANSVMQSGNAFENIRDGFTRMLETMVLQLASKAAVFGLLNLFTGGTFGEGKSVFDYVFGGFRANGGNMESGKSYITGERGPELITMGPGQSAKVTPNSQMGNLTIHFNGSEKAAMSKETDIQLAERIRRVIRNYNLNLSGAGAY